MRRLEDRDLVCDLLVAVCVFLGAHLIADLMWFFG